MNKQANNGGRRGIEWTDYTWNPVRGCQHGCRWVMPDGEVARCYAESVAQRVAQAAYPDGFERHYWKPEILNEPLSVRRPSRIFIDSMSDLMGSWVPSEQIEMVLSVCRAAHWHVFQLLTKNAPRLRRFQFPDNVWVGISAPPTMLYHRPLTQDQQVRLLRTMLRSLEAIEASVRWISIEPLSFDIASHLSQCDLQWAVIGAATNGTKTYQPRAEWVHNVLEVLNARAVPIFFKGNLLWHPRREEFPERTPNSGHQGK